MLVFSVHLYTMYLNLSHCGFTILHKEHHSQHPHWHMRGTDCHRNCHDSQCGKMLPYAGPVPGFPSVQVTANLFVGAIRGWKLSFCISFPANHSNPRGKSGSQEQLLDATKTRQEMCCLGSKKAARLRNDIELAQGSHRFSAKIKKPVNNQSLRILCFWK